MSQKKGQVTTSRPLEAFFCLFLFVFVSLTNVQTTASCSTKQTERFNPEQLHFPCCTATLELSVLGGLVDDFPLAHRDEIVEWVLGYTGSVEADAGRHRNITALHIAPIIIQYLLIHV